MNLRNCPVCGNQSISRFREGLAREENEEMYFIDIYVDYYIECPYCGHNITGGNWEEAEENWNTKEPSQLELNHWAKRNKHEGTTT